jgi:HK97 family phage portal protein
MSKLGDFISGIFTKENPAQPIIALEEGSHVSSDQPISISKAYKDFEVVQNGVTMLVTACSEFDVDIKDTKLSEGIPNLRKSRLESLLNHKPNPYQDIQTFRNQLFMDFVLEGNIFMYWDGAYLYHIPASGMQIVPDEKTYVKKYMYQNRVTYLPNEIIHIQDTGMESIYRGTSRLASAVRSLTILNKMRSFQENFFENGCVPGLVLETENTLSQPAKDRTIANWMKVYNPKNGAKKPMIIDSGLKLKSVAEHKFTDLDFEVSTASYERKVLKALGIPPILMDGGNNANIAPNLRLFYLETVLPIVRKYVSGCERFFGFDLQLITGTVSALQPDLKEVAEYHSSLVNAGILTPNEARVELRYPELPGKEATDIRVPANIAGSAADPAVGGKPKEPAANN